MSEAKTDGRTVTLKGVRPSFADGWIDKKKAADTDDAKPKFSANLLLEVEGPYAQYFDANKAKVMAAIEAAGEQEWQKADKWKDIAEHDKKRVCFRKGDSFKNQETSEVYKGYAGNWALSTGTPRAGQKRPVFMRRNKTELSEIAKNEDDLKSLIDEFCYGGVYGDAVVSFYGTRKGGNGIFCVVEGFRSYEEGERMGGGVTVTGDMFEDLDDGDDDLLGGVERAKPATRSDDDLLG